MAKIGIQNRNRPRSFKKKLFCCVFASVVLFILLHPNLNARSDYSFIPRNLILENLHKELVKNYSNSASIHCQYNDIIFDETTLSLNLRDDDLGDDHKILEGGEYYPRDCVPKFSVAIIVPYRDRPEQLNNLKSPTEELHNFLVYMHKFLQRQRIHYQIYVIEKIGLHSSFNRAKIFNIGAKAAMDAGYPCLILHDVDLLPMSVANIYACTKLPRHMSSCISTMRYVLPQVKTFSGAKAILSKQYLEVNGMSNKYDWDDSYGQRNADSDLYLRLEARNMTPCRFDQQISRYFDTSLRQLKRTKWNEHPVPTTDRKEDGLSNLRYTKVVTVMHSLFTHIVVDLAVITQG